MPLLYPAEAARELSISEKTLRTLTVAGKIKYVNIGLGEKRETRRYDPADLEEFKEARKCQSTSAQAKRPTVTTSVFAVTDILAQRNARLAAKQKPSKSEKRTR